MALTPGTLADKTVTTAGTRVQVTTANLLVWCVSVQALSTNTGKIYLGDSNVSSTRCIAELPPGGACIIEGYQMYQKGLLELLDISGFWIDSSANGDKVHLGYLIKSS